MTDDQVRAQFRAKLNAWLGEHDMTVAQLANSMGMSKVKSVHNWTEGWAFPRPMTLRRLCVATGTSADWWLGLEER